MSAIQNHFTHNYPRGGTCNILALRLTSWHYNSANHGLPPYRSIKKMGKKFFFDFFFDFSIKMLNFFYRL